MSPASFDSADFYASQFLLFETLEGKYDYTILRPAPKELDDFPYRGLEFNTRELDLEG